jgi:hypothetical protein
MNSQETECETMTFVVFLDPSNIKILNDVFSLG